MADPYEYDEAAQWGAVSARKVTRGLVASDLRKLAHPKELSTDYGAARYWHRGRGGDPPPPVRTNFEQSFDADDTQCIEDVERVLEALALVQVDLRILRGDPSHHARLYVPGAHADLAYMAAQSFDAAPRSWIERDGADLTVIALPEWTRPCVLLDGKSATAYVLGTDDYAEVRAAFLRLTMHKAKGTDAIALYAAAKTAWVRSHDSEELRRCDLLFLGLAGTGKTTLACSDLDLDISAGEKTRVRQAGLVLAEPERQVRGTEGGALYVRTENLNVEDHPSLYDACCSERAVLENVWLSPDGSADFYDTLLTSEARALAPLEHGLGGDGRIDLERCTHIFFLTHNPWLPPACRLTPAQAAITFLLGESILSVPKESEIHYEGQWTAGANPLRTEIDEEEIHRFFDLVAADPPIETVLLNTGAIGMGDNTRTIRPAETAAIIREVCRGGAQWAPSERFGLDVLEAASGIDLDALRVERYFDGPDLDDSLTRLRKERQVWLDRFPALRDEIKSALY